MDGRQFDVLVRSLIAHGDRRRVVRGLAGGTLALLTQRRLGGAAQSSGSIGLGEPCRSAGQCKQDFMGSEISCADNGIEKDGALTCCREDGCCVRDADCCGDRLCAPSGDVCSYCARPPFPTRRLGEPCGDDAECIPSVNGSVICADNGIGKDGERNCCFEEGGYCTTGDHAHCCGSLRCIGERCQDSALVAGSSSPFRRFFGPAG